MRKFVFIILLLSVGLASSCQRRGCVSYDKKTGQMKVSDKPHEKNGGLMPKNPKKAF